MAPAMGYMMMSDGMDFGGFDGFDFCFKQR
jgi:hypothetical protein